MLLIKEFVDFLKLSEVWIEVILQMFPCAFLLRELHELRKVWKLTFLLDTIFTYIFIPFGELFIIVMCQTCHIYCVIFFEPSCTCDC